MALSLPRLTQRAFTDLGVWMMLFGCAVGVAFPGFTILFGVPRAVAASPRFVLACCTDNGRGPVRRRHFLALTGGGLVAPVVPIAAQPAPLAGTS